jgi:hypothetical protein
VESKALRRVLSVWPSIDDALHELKSISSALFEPSEYRDDFTEKLASIRSGSARPRKDYKLLVGFSQHRLSEARWQIEANQENFAIRLIYSELENGDLLILNWHIKDPKQPQSIQRALQNQACWEAVQRKENYRESYEFSL